MNCDDARPLLDADLDRELSPTDALRVGRHLDDCAACRCERAVLASASRAVRDDAGYHRAPEALRARIIAGLPAVTAQAAPAAAASAAQPGRPRSRAGWWARWFGPRGAAGVSAPAGASGRGRAFAAPGAGWLAGLGLALALAAAVTALNARRDATATLVDELVASHVRAGLSGRDIDVVSTDQHTVKPWFNGRLDYAPPVVDLAADGFALAGGRLDYVAQRRVGVLIYRYRKHVIDVYVLPGATTPFATVEQGYALARWPAAGMTWWAVSDAEPSALAALRTALAARLPGRTE
jgi:anti-sigma factor RsiW